MILRQRVWWCRPWDIAYRFLLCKVSAVVTYEGGVLNVPAVSVPAGPPPAIRIVEAPGRSLWNFVKAFAVASWDPCRVHNGEAELVPVAMIRVEYGTDVVTDGASGLMVTVFWPSSSPVAEPRTRAKWSAGYSLKPSSIGRKAFEMGRRSGLTRVRGAPIFQKKWVEEEIRVTL